MSHARFPILNLLYPFLLVGTSLPLPYGAWSSLRGAGRLRRIPGRVFAAFFPAPFQTGLTTSYIDGVISRPVNSRKQQPRSIMWRLRLARAFSASLLLMQPLVAAPTEPSVIVGRAYVIDGDTVSITRGGQRTKVRLNGVDAPELDTRAGRGARTAMRRIIGDDAVRCELNGERSHDRLIGTCYLPDGADIGREIIAQGFALECPRYSGGRYRDVEVARGRLPASPYCRQR